VSITVGYTTGEHAHTHTGIISMQMKAPPSSRSPQ